MQICNFQFLHSGIDQSTAYKGAYNPSLVVFSVIIASMAGYVALKIADRIKQAPMIKAKRNWGMAGAITMGIGIWSMHFTGMLAFSLPVKIYYDPTITLISVIPGIIASGIALYFLNTDRIGFWRLNLGGVLLGVGIGTMHYTGMLAMITEADMYYDPVFFALSILVAHILATIALYVKFASQKIKRLLGVETVTVASAVIIGCAIAGMHYTGMKAAVYLQDATKSVSEDMLRGLIEPGGLTFFIILGTVIIMGITLGSTFVDKYLLELRTLIAKLNKEINERKVIEKSLQKSLQEVKDMKFALDQHCIVAVTDQKGMITYANDKFCDISKFPREELLGQDHRIVNSGYHPKEFIRDLWRTIASGRVWHGEIKNKAKDGGDYWVDTSIIPFVNDQGKPYQYIAIRTDITENKLNEENLKKEQQLAIELGKEAQVAAKAKSEFLANMSHEIRTPMNAILGFCDLLQKTSLNKTQEKYIDVLQSSGTLLCSVVNSILDFSKMESGKVTLESIDFNLHYLLKDVLHILSARFQEKGVQTRLDTHADVPRILKGDPTKIRQVMINLLSNAEKFTPSGGEVNISVCKEKDHFDDGSLSLRFTVRDTGIGIPRQSLEHIFKPFHQADTSTTREFGGTGLGLTITKSIVEAMGGKIWVESEEGKGSTFIFTVHLCQGESAAKKDIYPVEIKSVANRKVLIVDDNCLSREILNKACVSLGMEVLSVERSAFAVLETLAKLLRRKNLPDLILSDIRMEGMDGYELAEKIRKNRQYKKIKIISLTSDVFAGQSTVAKAKGFDGYLSKPFMNEDLVKVISTVFGDRREEGSIVTKHMANELGCKGIRVLIVEDNEPNQMLMLEYSKELGCESDVAENGQKAIDMLKQGKQYDVILMDFHMPIMGGVEACRIIRKEINKDTPIVALTAAVLDEDRKDAEGAGMNDFLAKPIDIDDLREKIIRYGRKV